MRGKREQRQLKLIEEFVSVVETAGAGCWLRGGWALDFLLGRVTRAHEDLDLFIWAADAPKLLPILERHGFEEVGGPPPAMQRNLVKGGEELHVTLLERNEIGVVTASGRRADAPWPGAMLDGPIGRVGHIRCRVISPEAQLYAKTKHPHALSRAPREQDQVDIALLRHVLADQARRQSNPQVSQ